MQPAGLIWAPAKTCATCLLITIDPADARDHDDAVFAREPDNDPKNPGGYIRVWVAIADVAALCHARGPSTGYARRSKRGNSTYFPDRVVPMLPDRLSGDLCSLHEGVPRPCLAVEDGAWMPRATRFTTEFTARALMRSACLA